MINIPVKPRRNLFCQEYEAFSFQLKSLAWYISIIDKRNWEPINIIKTHFKMKPQQKTNNFCILSLTDLAYKIKYHFLIPIFTICDESKNIHQNCIKLSNPFPNKTNPDKTKEDCAVSSLKNLNVSLDEPHPPSVV